MKRKLSKGKGVSWRNIQVRFVRGLFHKIAEEIVKPPEQHYREPSVLVSLPRKAHSGFTDKG